MHLKALRLDLSRDLATDQKPPVEWDWSIEHADRKSEEKADAALHGAHPFQVDRKVLRDVVREKMGVDVGRIVFLSSGTFHKAYLVTLSNHGVLVARVARRFMPRIKTESEVATMNYLREHTSIPVPKVYHYDANPYNRLGGEFILMSKAPGIPLAKVYHSMSHGELLRLMGHLASMIIPLFAHRFSCLGSLYFTSNNPSAPLPSSIPTPKATQYYPSPFSMSNLPTPKPAPNSVTPEIQVGPIVSWPFFGSNRGELLHPNEIDRGPWHTTHDYFLSCVEREVGGVIRENEGKSAPHRLHLDPAEIMSSRHHHLKALPGDQSDESDEWDLEESEEEWEGPGDVMYRDYRRMQRSTFLVAHMATREQGARKEMQRWMRLMERLGVRAESTRTEEFGLDCHDLSLENVFVDEKDNAKITCIIDWESTTTRPLWACAHLPAFLQSSAFTADLFREAVRKLATVDPGPPHALKGRQHIDLAALAHEWLHHESTGVRLRTAHRFVEWDGWEEGLIDSILGPEEQEDDWLHDFHDLSKAPDETSPLSDSTKCDTDGSPSAAILAASLSRLKAPSKLPFVKEKEKQQVLNTTGDICGGRGGELGRRLEAWLVNDGGQKVKGRCREYDEDYDAEAE